jgi:O-methyltransferase
MVETILNYILILAVLVLLLLYLRDLFIGWRHRPEEWKHACREGLIPPVLRKTERNFPDKIRFFAWWLQVERLKREKVPGSFAELGVYQGESARALHHMDPERRFHLFDTFTGFTGKDLSVETGEASTYTESNFADTYINKVKSRISGNDNLFFHPGYFPETAVAVEREAFALVNLDADLYNPTRTGLEFFYPRLSPGGVLFIHDCNHKWDGIRKAVGEFAGTIPEVPVFLPDKEGTVLIVKGR